MKKLCAPRRGAGYMRMGNAFSDINSRSDVTSVMLDKSASPFPPTETGVDSTFNKKQFPKERGLGPFMQSDQNVEVSPHYSISRVLFTAIQGLNLVENCLDEAKMREDQRVIDWLQESKECYQRILRAAEKI